jgi:ethanolamine transporter EutH
MGKRRIAHEASISFFLIFCKKLSALIALAVVQAVFRCGSDVTAGLDPVIHENTAISIQCIDHERLSVPMIDGGAGAA